MGVGTPPGNANCVAEKNVKLLGLFFSKQLPEETSPKSVEVKYVMSAARKAIGIGGGLRPLRASLFRATRLLLTDGSASKLLPSGRQALGGPLFAAHQPTTPIPTKPLSSTVLLAIT